MKKRLISVLLLTIFFTACSQTQHTAINQSAPVNQEKIDQLLINSGYQVIKFNQIKSGHAVVSAKLNGIRGNFILDTGAISTSLHHEFLNKFKICETDLTKTMTMVGFNSKTTTGIYSIESFSIDRHSIDLDCVYLLDLTPIVRALKKNTGVIIHGIIGQDLLQNHNAIIDVNGSSLYLAG